MGQSDELSPERQRLRQLHARNEQLRAAAAEPHARLARIDEIIAKADAAKAHVAALTSEYSTRLEEALANGDVIPAKSHELIRAEASAIVSDEHRAAAERAREHVAAEVQQMGAQIGALGQEIASATLRVVEEAAEAGLRGEPLRAWRACVHAFTPYEGLVEVLESRGVQDTEALQAAYRIRQMIAGVTAGPRPSPDVAAARAFIEALAEDGRATLIDGNGVCVTKLPEPAATTPEAEEAHGRVSESEDVPF